MHRFLVLVGLVRDTPENLARLGNRRWSSIAALVLGAVVVVVLARTT